MKSFTRYNREEDRIEVVVSWRLEEFDSPHLADYTRADFVAVANQSMFYQVWNLRSKVSNFKRMLR